MLRFNKDKVKVDIDLNSITKSSVPLLIEDEIWIKLFSDIKDKNIKNAKTELRYLVDESRKIKQDLPKKKSEKKELINKILTLSEKINNNEVMEGIELLDTYKNQLNQLNDDIDEITFKSETIPSKVRLINLNLLEETIKYAYGDIVEAEDNLSEYDIELKELRKRLRRIIEEKYDYEEKRNEIYQFLHNALGAEMVDKLDRKILD